MTKFHDTVEDNRSGVAFGMYNEKDVLRFTDKLLDKLLDAFSLRLHEQSNPIF